MNPRPPSPRPCPVCSSSGDRRVRHRQRFEGGALGDGYDVAICQACGAAFADGIPPQAELDAYYANLSKYTLAPGGQESPFDLRRFELIVRQVAPHLPARTARLLDVGCATGGLLSVFRRAGFVRVLGADPSPACAAEAGRRHGIEVRVATLAALAGWSEQFDLITLVGVLEHLRDVPTALRTLVARLAPGGRLFVAVPDLAGFASCRNAPFQQLSMEHVNFFSAASLHRALAAAGCAPVAHWREVVEWREGVTEPVLAGLFEPGRTAAPSFDAESEPALERYLAVSRAADEAIARRIDQLVRRGEPLLVWGAGALARRLLATTALAQANITAFVDSNPHLQGRELAGRRVIGPAEVSGRAEPILLLSMPFEAEIRQEIRARLGLAHPVLTLWTD
jgi:2-polyprenyl-3-methyl-5-hydroxy-6-metoxy-1,4-benzoquinol methylase